MNSNDGFRKPVTLYVQGMDFEPGLEMLMEDRISSVDIELDREKTLALVQELLHRLDSAHTVAVRVRFTGRLVH
jgi:hypothetical protein